MNKEIIVNVSSLESRVAMLEDGRLAELHVEREPSIVGNIYKARVATILPGMGATFVDIGTEKHAFLCADEATYSLDDSEAESPTLHQREKKRVGNLVEGLKTGQELLVQVNRAAVGGKGARASTRLALPGRFLVLLLTDHGRVGVSRKIEDEKTRQRLKKLAEEICPPDCGLIVRTEAEEARRPQLLRDLEFLLELRKRLFENSAKIPAPALLHEDSGLVLQIIRDSFTRDVSRLLIDSEEIYNSALKLIEMIAPGLKKRLIPYKETLGIFEHFGLEEEIARLWQRKVWLKAGGYISFDQAEALCAIDVNTARFTGKGRMGQAETILQTNMEAAAEIARQLRLRDIGGLIVVDFIDMESAAHRAKVLRAFEEALEGDRAKTRTYAISRLGLVEMTRKKQGESLLEKISEVCPECGGLGRVRNAASVGLQIQRELRTKAKERPAVPIAVFAPAPVVLLLMGTEGEAGRRLTEELQRPLYIRARGEDPRNFEIGFMEPGEVAEKVGSFHVGQRLNCRRLEDNVAVSEEGYVIGVSNPLKRRSEQFTVELQKATPYWGMGRALIKEGGEVAEVIKRPAGIRRRAYRVRTPRRPETAAKETPPTPVMELPKTVTPEIEKAPAAGSQTTDQRRSSRRRRYQPRGEQAATPQGAAIAPPEAKATAAPEEVKEKKSRRRRHRKPRSQQQAPAVEAQPAVAAAPPPETSVQTPAQETVAPHKPRRRRRYPRRKTEIQQPEATKSAEHIEPVAPEPPPPAEGAVEIKRKNPRRRYYRPRKKPEQPSG